MGAAAAVGSTAVSQAVPYMNAPQTAQVTTTPGAAYVDEKLLTAKLEAVEARTETKFAQLLGKLDTLGERLTGLNDKIGGFDAKIESVDGHVRNAKATIVAVILGTGIAVAALAYAAVQIFEAALSLK